MPTPATRLAAWIVLAIVAGCSRPTEADVAFAAQASAIEAKERAGDVEGAAREWRALAESAPTREARATAELGSTRCQAALAARDHGRALIESLPAEVDRHSLAALDAMAAEQAARFAGGPFEAEFRALHERIREECRVRAAASRDQQAAIARAIVARGEFCAALDYLQQLERGRSPDDRADVLLLLDELNAASDRAADLVSAEIAPAAAADPAAALARLDEALPRFHGSTGAVRLAKARVEIAGRSPAASTRGSGKTPREDEDEP